MASPTFTKLGEIAREVKRSAPSGSALPVYSVTKHQGFVPSLEYFNKQVFSRNTKGYNEVKPGELAYATIHLNEGSIGVCPVHSIISPMYTVFAVDENRVDARYLERYLKSPRALTVYKFLGKGSVHRRASISFARLATLDVPLPSLAEQRRISATLDKAGALITKRRGATAKLDQLLQAVFVDMFGDPVTNSKGWPSHMSLGDVADICSGITKGRRTADATKAVPYLAVANVQDRHLRLSSVKTIEATDVEIRRYRLQVNDLLLTEGGDPDKLGRGVLWDGSIPECIHQNHIFRVRPTTNAVHPIYLSWLVASARGKRYFLSSAKQTTGIASINMKQLKRFPLLLPPAALQGQFAQIVTVIEAKQRRGAGAVSGIRRLIESIQHRAFAGSLWP